MYLLNKKIIVFSLILSLSLFSPVLIFAQESSLPENKSTNNLWRNIYCAFNWRHDSSCVNNQSSGSTQESLSENKITINSTQNSDGLTVLQIYSIKGDKGDKGDIGQTGEQGPTGPQGIPGTAALKGDKGDPGASGGTGAKGDKGDSGATGATGPQGPAGENGSASITCSDGQILKWSDGQWTCSADAGGSSYTASGSGLELNVTQLSLELDGGSLSTSTSGLKIADTYDDNFALTTGSYSNPNWLTSLAGAKITGNISGNAGSVTNGIYTTTDFAGDVTGKYNLLTLANSGVTAGTYGDTGSNITQITVNSKGQVTSASNRSLTKSNIGLGNVENTALSTWTGTGTLTTLGTISTGIWNGSDITLGSYTSGNYVSSVSNGSGISGGSSGSEGATLTLSLDINGLTTQSGGVSDDDLIAVYDTSSSANRKLTRSQLLAGVTGALVYQGTWSATSNSPSLNDTTGVQGKYYVASDDGSVDFDAAGERSSVAFTAGDWVVHNGTRWEKLDNANNVQSVFGRQGIVAASSGDYIASQIGSSASGNISSTNVQDSLNELDTEKQAQISAGTTSQYYRGDKSWQTLDKTAVGLGNVENTTLSTWTGSTNITTLGTITSGTWNGSDIALGTRTSGNYVAGATSLGGLVLTGAEGGTLGILLDGNTLSVGESGLKIADGLVSNWNSAYGWGNHASANYLTANSTATLTNKSGNISQWTNDTAYITDGNTNWNNSYNFITGLDFSQVTNGSGVYFDYKPNNTACSSNQTLKYTVSTGWVCADDNNTTYTAGVGLTLNGTTLAVNDNYVLNTGDTITGDLTINGNVTVNGNIIPGADNTYDIGSSSAQWGEIYASNNTIYIGGVALSNNSGSLTWNGSALGGGGGTTTLQNISSGTTLTSWTRTIKADATTASVTVTLPTASGNSGQAIEIIKTDNSTNTVRIIPSNGQTINGSVNPIYIYSQNDSVVIRSDGSNSFIVADNRSSVGSSKSYLQARTNTNQFINTSGNAINFSSSLTTSYGSDISFNGTSSFTLKAGKTYRLSANPGYTFFDLTSGYASFQWKDTTQGTWAGTSGQIDANSNTSSAAAPTGSDAVAVVTPSVDTVYQFQVLNENGLTSVGQNSAGPYPSAYIEVISTPQNVVNTVDYVYARPSSTAVSVGNTTIPVTSALQGNISISNNMFSLKAGKTYELEAFMDFSGVAGAGQRWAQYLWTDASGTQLPGSNIALAIPPQSDATDSVTLAKAIITPTTDMSVKLMTTATVTNVSGINTNQSYFKIIQIGSVASTGIALNNIIAATNNGSLDNLNYSQTWNWSTADDEVVLTLAGNSLTTGGLLNLTSSSNSLNSTNGLLYIANTGTGTSGVVARIQSNSNTNSGLTVLASGNVGIGTSNPTQKFEISGGMLNVINSGTAPGAGPEFAMGSIGNGYKWIQSYHSQALVLNPIGNNVGIGSTTPTSGLQVNVNSSYANTEFDRNGFMIASGEVAATNMQLYMGADDTSRISYIQSTGHSAAKPLVLQARGGYVGIGTTDPSFLLTVSGARNNDYMSQIINDGTTPHGLQVKLNSAVSGSNFVGFFNSSSSVGGIAYNGTGVNYNQTSDQRLKENIVDTHFGVLDLMKINVRDFEYKSDSSDQTLNGFVAQELQKIYPDAVTVGTDEVDDNGNLVHPWMVDYGRLTPLIVKSIQDQQQTITQNSDQITSLDLRVKNSEENFDQEKLTEMDNKIISIGERLSQITEGAVTFKQNVEFQGPVIFKKIAEFIDKVVFKENVTLEKQLCFKKADSSEVCLDADKVEKLINTLPTETPAPTPATPSTPSTTITPSPSPTPDPIVTPPVEPQPQADPSPTETPSITPTETPINN